MVKIKILIEEKYKILVCLFFMVFLLIGIFIFKDFGMTWDDQAQRDYGVTVIRYVMEGDQELLNIKNKYHGPFFTMLLTVIEKILRLTDSRYIYLMRHLVTFLLFYTSVFFFYRLCKYRFNSWKIGLLGSLFLILSPRIFAHSFYNPKDLPFLSMFIISIYTLVSYLNRKTLPRAAIHALICALLIDIRILGIIVPLFTVIFLFADLLIIKPIKIKNKKIIGSFLLYMALLISFTILFWPTLWENPVYHFIEAFKEMSRYPWIGSMLYLGDYISSLRVPWHYIPIWILVTTPLLYTALFLIGCFSVIKLLFKNPKQCYINRRDDLIFILWFFLPLASIIILKSVVHDAWRHMLFIYPPIVILSLEGLIYLSKSIKIKFKGLSYRVINIIFILIIASSLIHTAQFMIRYHPHQNVYFNILAGKNMKEVKNSFELDYWGLSYRQALEYILKNDKDKVIKIYVANACGWYNSLILPSDDRKRLVYVKRDSLDEAKYFISNYRWHKDEYPYEDEYFSIKIGGTKIMVVYRL